MKGVKNKILRGDEFCPAQATMELLGCRWTMQIVRALEPGVMRFNELAKTVGVNPRTLCTRLRRLEQDGIVERRVVSAMPPNVEYELTAKGRALNEVLESLIDWGATWMADHQ